MISLLSSKNCNLKIVAIVQKCLEGYSLSLSRLIIGHLYSDCLKRFCCLILGTAFNQYNTMKSFKWKQGRKNRDHEII